MGIKSSPAASLGFGTQKPSGRWLASSATGVEEQEAFRYGQMPGWVSVSKELAAASSSSSSSSFNTSILLSSSIGEWGSWHCNLCVFRFLVSTWEQLFCAFCFLAWDHH
jgi:hypothetical protein